MINIFSWESIEPKALALDGHVYDGKIVLGIDGIIDTVWTLVKQRFDRHSTEPLSTMGEFGLRIYERRGTALSHEILPKRQIAGGFTANTGLAVGHLGIKASLIGMFGSGEIDPVFADLAACCRLFNLGPPATCQIFEFFDGKLMLPYLQGLLDVDWNALLTVFGLDQLKAIFGGAKVVSLGYWSNMPTFDQLLQMLYQEVLSTDPPEYLFFDFADIAKRTRPELRTTLELLATMDSSIPVVLSLNDAEAKQVFDSCGKNFTNDHREVAATAATVREQLGISELVVHTPTYAVCTNEDTTAVVVQDFCAQPVRTVGAGDTFNAGYMVSLINGWLPATRLAVANATTSFFIRNGHPPVPAELRAEIKRIAAKLHP